ncbi:MAG: TRAP transporter small permease subunit [Candidatus Eiseniibacteriota bacterium]
MRVLLAIVRSIDRLNERLGRGVAWLTLAMVLIGAYNAVARYLGRFIGVNLSSNAYIELQWYLFSLVFLLGAADALRQDVHVRVDVVYGRLSARARAWINLGGSLLFLIPFSSLALWLAWPSVRNSWAVLEGSPDPGGLPRYPIKTVILVAFALLLVQGVAEAIRQLLVLRGHRGSAATGESGAGLDARRRDDEAGRRPATGKGL